MIVRIITLFAALGLLAACETAPNTAGDAAGTGASSSTSSSSADGRGSGGSEQMTITDELIEIGDRVLFGFDSYELTSDAKSTLNSQASFLAANPSVRITIEGHCDERGTREYNLALGERRASASRDFLLAQGIDAARVRIVSYGKERPAVEGSNESAWAKNRRSATIIN